MRKNVLFLFFGVLGVAFVFLAGCITGAEFWQNLKTFETGIVIVSVALVSAAIGSVCTKPPKTKTKKKDAKDDIYSHTV